MRIIVGFESSQVVAKAFRALGHEAFSCDILPCEGGHPEWHIQEDVLNQLDKGWELGIFHPPCTFLCSSGLHWNKRVAGRNEETEKALIIVESVLNAPIPKIALENPVGCISSRIRKPDQIIQPYQFGEDASKATCLWLKGLPKLRPTFYFPPRIVNCKKRWSNQTDSGQNRLPPSADRWRLRSKTYEGIGKAMAEQWTAMRFVNFQLQMAI